MSKTKMNSGPENRNWVEFVCRKVRSPFPSIVKDNSALELETWDITLDKCIEEAPGEVKVHYKAR